MLRLVAAHDVGRVINPDNVEGQILGGVGQGIGWTLYEDMPREKGKVLNPNYLEYKIPTVLDVSDNIEAIMVESINEQGPWGAKGIGEQGIIATAPAITNAVYNAVGVRIYNLPITREKLLNALKEKEAQQKRV